MLRTSLTKHLQLLQPFSGVQTETLVRAPGPHGLRLPLHELAACATREATIVNDGPPMVG
jgi:hypothetical protein